MKTQSMTYYGVGPRIMRPTAIYGIIAILLTIFSPKLFLMNFMPSAVFHIIGGIFLGFGIAFLYISSKAMKIAVSKGKLETTGTFALVRNPLYFGWMFFIFTGIAIVSQAWLIFGMPALAYFRFNKLISQEEDALEEAYGEEYITYKKNVPLIIPRCKDIF
ncbi:methyltransferase family protein [Maridesulfovibrio frigidus]|uniref:methyltransferase family protein n=1 Tax=Maridesulfovibrio frigidus TaxID=340956 RepID=UPI0004E0B59E|nr:isoprenylcysteine carboxylmethyltransferase family protein [Maridesulfovibrio frigidus]